MSPNLTIIFPIIRGLVTDRGGAMASAAIVAREEGIPVAGGTEIATVTVHSGDVIRVDGTLGRIEVISSGQGHPN